MSLEALEDRAVPSGTPELLKNVNPGTESSFPEQFTEVGDTIFFAARDDDHGRELWKTDGTAAGTALVKDIDPGDGGSYPEYLTNFNGTLFFTADDGDHGTELWKSDGTAAGTVLVKDINPGSRRLQSLQPDGHRTDAVLHGQRRGERCGAVEERRHRRRHRPGQGHPPRQRRLRPLVTTPW